jgi:lipopolysaccharide export system protein LptA
MNYTKILLLSWAIFSPTVFALAADSEQPINITADRATIDDASGTAIYEGNVVISQGTIRINAVKVTLNYTAKQTLEKVVAEGDPVSFKQTPEGGKEDIQAKAKKMEYFADKSTIHLTQQAELSQGKDSFAGEHISYNTQDGIIRADKGGNDKGRISVVIQPRPKETSTEKK